MRIEMDFKHIRTIEDIRNFVAGSRRLVLKAVTIDEKYEVIDQLLDRISYLKLSRHEKHTVLLALKIITGYKKSQLFGLIERALQGTLGRKKYIRINKYRKYQGADIDLLEKTDELHYRLSASATHEILRREYELFGKKEYMNVAAVSISHINNLRSRTEYLAKYLHHTQARSVAIGHTEEPEPNGRPGSIRVDTVSQRDIFYLNAVCEVTQWEIVIAVPQISERFLTPVLQLLLNAFPFRIFNFHSDRGSEFINRVVARILHKLLIRQTKSRSRHSNDNALVESKNGSVIRKNFGYGHMNQKLVDKINDFLSTWFNPYLNYHRTCGYVTSVEEDYKGRARNVYGQYTTPYEKLKEVSKQQKKNFLKPGISFEKLDILAYRQSDNDAAREMRRHQYELFDITSLLKSL